MSIRLITYNIKFLPTDERIGGVRHRGRADRIVAALRPHVTKASVLCFQEVFKGPPRRRLIKQLAQLGLVERSLTPRLSGLLIVSNIPGDAIQFREFAAQDGWDYWARKSVCGAHLRVQGSNLFVFTTHLQSGTRAPAAWTEQIQQDQLRTIREYVRTSVDTRPHPGPTRVALCGDFNVRAETEDNEPTPGYHYLCDRLGVARDLYRQQHPAAPGWTYSAESPTRRIDYVLDLAALPFAPARPVAAFSSTHCDLLRMPGPYAEFSDHRPLVADLTI